MELKVGDQAPDFSLPTNQGHDVTLAAMRGKPFVLYFYPKADTPGCTREAVGFQEALAELTKSGIAVIGVSRDPMRAIEAFATKYSLAFPLASDGATEVAKEYGTWVEKSRYGRKYMGMERATFLIDGAGRVAHIWRNVRVDGHVADVLREAAKL